MNGQKETNHFFIDRDALSILIYRNGAYFGTIICWNDADAKRVEDDMRRMAADDTLRNMFFGRDEEVPA